jgi:ankyrin repeat protein
MVRFTTDEDSGFVSVVCELQRLAKEIQCLPVEVGTVGSSGLFESKSRTNLAPIRLATREGQNSPTQLLIKEQQDFDVIDADGTALRRAIKYGRGMTAWLLIQAGADINKPDSRGFSLLHWVAYDWQKCPDKSFIWVLLENNAEINAQSKLGLTALHIVSSQGASELVWLLLEKGAMPCRVDNNGRTVLHCAVTEGHTSVAQILVHKTQLLIHATDDEKKTALHIAASLGDLPTGTLLLNSGAKLDVRDREGYIPLHRAVSLKITKA